MREDQSIAYDKWVESPTKENMQGIVKSVDRLIGSEVMRYQGTLKPSVLKSYAKKYVADAVRNYNPDSGAHISTHIINSLKRLHRLNYKNVQGLKSSENVQSKINTYLNTSNLLGDQLGRDPTPDEIAKEMGTTTRFVKRLKNSLKHEQGDDMAFNPAPHYEYDPEREALDLVYHDAPDTHKKIIEFKTGYNGFPILPNTEIAKKLNLSTVRVSQIAGSIGGKLKKFLHQ